jgi:hypothetical protein
MSRRHDHLSFARIELCQSFKHVIDSDQFAGAPGRDFRHVVEIDFWYMPAPFSGYAGARGIHQDAPHHLRRNRKEMRAIQKMSPVTLSASS